MDWNRIFNPGLTNNTDSVEMIKVVRARYRLDLGQALRLVEELDREVDIERAKNNR